MYDKDRSTGGSLGEILDIQVTPGTKQAELDDGTVAMVPCEGYYDVLLTLQAEALIESDGNYAVNRIYDLASIPPGIQYQVRQLCRDHCQH